MQKYRNQQHNLSFVSVYILFLHQYCTNSYKAPPTILFGKFIYIKTFLASHWIQITDGATVTLPELFNKIKIWLIKIVFIQTVIWNYLKMHLIHILSLILKRKINSKFMKPLFQQGTMIHVSRLSLLVSSSDLTLKFFTHIG